MNEDVLRNKIEKLKKEKNAVIVAHTYQPGEIQEIADKVGDSFALSKYCSESEKKMIVFCGVTFMAESAKILSYDKTVLIPVKNAGCPMADMADEKTLVKMKEKHPKAAVVCYINSTAKVKALSDICCTSSNAVKVASSLNEKEIIFLPDKNLGKYAAEKVPDKKFIFWDGFCPVHNFVSEESVAIMKEKHPKAKLLVHPECTLNVIKKADFVGSTKAIMDYVNKSEEKEFIIGTEQGVIYPMEKTNPDKTFYLLSEVLLCKNMKKISLEDVYDSLNEEKYKVELKLPVVEGAKKALKRMLEVV